MGVSVLTQFGFVVKIAPAGRPVCSKLIEVLATSSIGAACSDLIVNYE